MYVALRASAWIETRRNNVLASGYAVALRASAWIETLGDNTRDGAASSHSVRVRGLKRGSCDIRRDKA